MQNILLVGAAVGCLLSAAASNSGAVESRASSAQRRDGAVTVQVEIPSSVFVGHYGEVLQFDDRWAAEAEMHDQLEVIRFHPRMIGRGELGSKVFSPYHPKAQDYVPENFTPNELAQVFVIPKSAPEGFKSLAKLRSAKEKELAASGLKFEFYAPDSVLWPDDSFGVVISTPYKLFQFYTQSDRNIFIVTTELPDPSTPMVDESSKLFQSLQKYLEPFQRQVSQDYLVYRNPRVMIPWGVVLLLAGTLGLLSDRPGWQGRLRLIGRTVLTLSACLPVLGVLAVLFSLRLGLDRWINMASVGFFFSVVLPFIGFAVSSVRGGRFIGRGFLWMISLNFIPALAAFAGMIAYWQGVLTIDGPEFSGVSLFLIILSLINGVCFGLTYAESNVNTSSEGMPQ